MNKISMRGGALLLCLALLLAGCSGQPTASPSPTAVPTAARAAATAGPPAARGGTSVPAPDQLQADLDNDGAPEQITARQQGDHVEIAIAPGKGQGATWRTSLPAGVVVSDLRSEALLGDHLRELLVDTAGPEADIYGVWVIRWQGGQGRILAPQGETLRDSAFFRSQYYRPLVEDLETDGLAEIAVSVKGTHDQFLDTIVYAWDADAQAFVESQLYMMPPRIMPTPRPK